MPASPCGAALPNIRHVFVCTMAIAAWSLASPCIREPRCLIRPLRDSGGRKRDKQMISDRCKSILILLALLVLCSPVLAQGGARIDKPFKRQVTGAQCYGGAGKYAGLVGFGFPDRSTRALAFTIGPLRDGLSPGQENNKPYSGPGS